MRPIEYKILKKLEKGSLTFEGIEEIVDGTSRQELKKSFPDDCHFQTSKYFARIIIESLLRSNFVRKEGNRYIHRKQDEKEKNSDSV